MKQPTMMKQPGWTFRFPLAVLLLLALAFPLVGAASAVPGGSADEPVRIGIAYNASQSAALKTGKDRNSRYVKAVESQGARAVLLRPDEDPTLLETRLSSIDGLLLPGGDDVAPARYGERPHPKLEIVDEPFDAFEFQLLESARNRKIPILGICRGHQILNVFLGGSLYQDIPSQLASGSQVLHRRRANGKNEFCDHLISVATGSLFADIVGTASLRVNTFHHQGVKGLGKGLRVGAATADGLAEVIEGTGPEFLLGVQFHPERDAATEPPMRAIIGKFVDAARRNRFAKNSRTIP